MGMSGDYENAIREGATLVRIGTAIYGERDYRKDKIARPLSLASLASSPKGRALGIKMKLANPAKASHFGEVALRQQ